ncbi:MAG: tetratricopeptide repeat protein, partial [Ignavibacteriota bacterium]
ELFLKSKEYTNRHTRADLQHAFLLLQDAVNLDPQFSHAHILLAKNALEYYIAYSREKIWIEKMEEHLSCAELILGDDEGIYLVRSNLARQLGNFEDAIELAKKAILRTPDSPQAYTALAFAYEALDREEDAVTAFKKALEHQQSNRTVHFNYLLALYRLGDRTQLGLAVQNARPLYEQYLRMAPDDFNASIEYADILSWGGESARALAEARRLEAVGELDSSILYNLACLYLQEHESESALRMLRSAVECGFLDVGTFRRDPDLDPLRGDPEFEKLLEQVSKKISKEQQG